MTTKMLLWYVGQVHKVEGSVCFSLLLWLYSTHSTLHLFQESKKAAHNLDQESEGSHSAGVRVTVSFSTNSGNSQIYDVMKMYNGTKMTFELNSQCCC